MKLIFPRAKELTMQNWTPMYPVNIIPADALALSLVRSSAGMILLVPGKEGFPAYGKSQISKINLYWVIQNLINFQFFIESWAI